MGEIVEALRSYQQNTRLEESRSRVGGHLLTLPGLHDSFDDMSLSDANSDPQSEDDHVPAPIQEMGLTSALASSRPPPAVEYVAQSAPPTPRTRQPRLAIRPPLITPLSPPASSRGSHRSGLRHEIVPGVAEEQESEIGAEILVGAQEMLAEAQDAIDFERRVLDEAQNRLHDISEALHDVEGGRAHGRNDSDPGDRDSVVLHEVANANGPVDEGALMKQNSPPTQDNPVVPPFLLR